MSDLMSRRLQNGTLWAWLLSCMLIVWAYYNEYVGGMLPCALCTIQRLFLILVVVFIALDWLLRHRFHRLTDGLLCLWCLGGLLAATRQWWLQWHPPVGPQNCLPGFTTLLDSMPWHQALWLSLHSPGGCAEVTWRILGVSAALWMAVFFMALLILFIMRLIIGVER